VVTDPALLEVLTPPFSAKRGDRALSTSTNREVWTKPLLAGQAEKVTGWQTEVRNAAAAARTHVDARLEAERARMRVALDARLDPGLEAARAVAEAAAQRLGTDHPEARQAAAEAAEEERQVLALRAAVAGARFDLDSIAYVMLG
jgi:hypothetical protein